MKNKTTEQTENTEPKEPTLNDIKAKDYDVIIEIQRLTEIHRLLRDKILELSQEQTN